MTNKNRSQLLVISIIFSLVGCQATHPHPQISEENSPTLKLGINDDYLLTQLVLISINGKAIKSNMPTYPLSIGKNNIVVKCWNKTISRNHTVTFDVKSGYIYSLEPSDLSCDEVLAGEISISNL